MKPASVSPHAITIAAKATKNHLNLLLVIMIRYMFTVSSQRLRRNRFHRDTMAFGKSLKLIFW